MARRIPILVTAFFAFALLGCDNTEQTTEADLKAATAGQVPDPQAASATSPMEGLRKGPPKTN